MSMLDSLAEVVGRINAFSSGVKGKLDVLYTTVKGHVLNVNNPHRVDKTDVGLSKVQNQAPATPEQAGAGVNNNTVMSPRRTDDYTAASIYDPLSAVCDAVIADLDA